MQDTPASGGGAGPEYQVQVLVRVVALLREFSVERPTLTIGELSRSTGLPRSTVHRLVVNLVQLGLLARDPVRDRYRLGLLLVRLGNAALGGLDVRAAARPSLEALARRSGEAAALAALDRPAAVYVDIVESDRRALSIKSRAGDRVPLHCSGTGKCLLAFLDRAEAARLLGSTGLPRLTAKTITDPEALLRELAAIRARGYSVDRGESEDGLASIAAPVRDADGAFFGAVCIAGPAERILGGSHDGLVGLVRAAADEISALIEAIGRSAWPPYTGPADALTRRR